MGAESGQPDTSVEIAPLPRRLKARPWDFSFYQAVRLVQRLGGATAPIGSFTHPSREPLRLGTHPSLSFPAAEIQSLEEGAGKPPKMTVNFFGLDGPAGILPTAFIELVIKRQYARDNTLRDFLDIFNHRMISLLYRAWEKYRFPVTYERSRDDPFTGYLLGLIGLGTRGLAGRQAVPDQALICYEGLLGQYPRSAASFRAMLSHYFQVKVEVHPFAGSWRQLGPGSRTCLQGGFSKSESLGVGMVLGDEIWDQQSVVRVRLGPMAIREYRQFLPNGGAYESLKALARFFCGDDLDVEVQLVLKREAAPRFALDAPGADPPRLGWLGWIFTRPLDRDPDETVFRLWEG
jgi:type VI secretion system protein ImpH